MNLNFSYEAMNAVMGIVKEFGLKPEHQHFDLNCSLSTRVWMRQIPAVTERIEKIEHCKIVMAD